MTRTKKNETAPKIELQDLPTLDALSQNTKDPVRIIALGGLGEIGMNCMIFESLRDAFLVDCGVLFSDLQMLGVDFYIPDFSYLETIQHKLKGYVITHAHEDHIGALPFALKTCPAPIYCTEFAKSLIQTKLKEHELTDIDIHIVAPGGRISFADFSIEPVWVNHSIVEATALLIHSPQGVIVHTGDFKFDSSPFYGSPLDPKPFLAAGRKGVRLLLSDSTNVERDGCSASEEELFHQFNELLPRVKGMTIVAVFASNIGRIGQILEVAKSMHKRVALLGRSMDQNARLAHEQGYLEGLMDVLIPLEDINKYPRNQVLILSTGSQGEYRSGLVRIAFNEHPFIKLQNNDGVILSSKFIPGNEKAIGTMINNLFRQGAQVYYEPIAHVHVSGHANAGELARMVQFTQPEYFIPVHGEYRHLVRHRQVAIDEGVDPQKSIVVLEGDVLELHDDGLKVPYRIEESRVMIEGSTGQDVTKLVVKDRRKVAETGIVFAVLIRNRDSGRLMADPDLMTRGFLDETAQKDILDEAKQLMIGTIDEFASKGLHSQGELQEEIRVQLRRFFKQRTGIKPVVMPILVEV